MRDCVTPTRQSAREPVAAELRSSSTLSLCAPRVCHPVPTAFGAWPGAVLPEPFRSVREVRSVVGVASRVYTGRAGIVCTCVCRSGTWSTWSAECNLFPGESRAESREYARACEGRQGLRPCCKLLTVSVNYLHRTTAALTPYNARPMTNQPPGQGRTRGGGEDSPCLPPLVAYQPHVYIIYDIDSNMVV